MHFSIIYYRYYLLSYALSIQLKKKKVKELYFIALSITKKYILKQFLLFFYQICIRE